MVSSLYVRQACDEILKQREYIEQGNWLNDAPIHGNGAGYGYCFCEKNGDTYVAMARFNYEKIEPYVALYKFQTFAYRDYVTKGYHNSPKRKK